jgi:hypothetical protein
MSKSRTTHHELRPARAKPGLIFLMILSLTRERGGKLKPLAVVVQRQRKMPRKSPPSNPSMAEEKHCRSSP